MRASFIAAIAALSLAGCQSVAEQVADRREQQIAGMRQVRGCVAEVNSAPEHATVIRRLGRAAAMDKGYVTPEEAQAIRSWQAARRLCIEMTVDLARRTSPQHVGLLTEMQADADRIQGALARSEITWGDAATQLANAHHRHMMDPRAVNFCSGFC